MDIWLLVLPSASAGFKWRGPRLFHQWGLTTTTLRIRGRWKSVISNWNLEATVHYDSICEKGLCQCQNYYTHSPDASIDCEVQGFSLSKLGKYDTAFRRCHVSYSWYTLHEMLGILHLAQLYRRHRTSDWHVIPFGNH
jgi:hypothetical protein